MKCENMQKIKVSKVLSFEYQENGDTINRIVRRSLLKNNSNRKEDTLFFPDLPGQIHALFLCALTK